MKKKMRLDRVEEDLHFFFLLSTIYAYLSFSFYSYLWTIYCSLHKQTMRRFSFVVKVLYLFPLFFFHIFFLLKENCAFLLFFLFLPSSHIAHQTTITEKEKKILSFFFSSRDITNFIIHPMYILYD